MPNNRWRSAQRAKTRRQLRQMRVERVMNGVMGLLRDEFAKFDFQTSESEITKMDNIKPCIPGFMFDKERGEWVPVVFHHRLKILEVTINAEQSMEDEDQEKEKAGTP